MSDDKKPFQSTPAATLEQHVMDARIAKSEAEWWASREIERLRARVEVLETALRYYADDAYNGHNTNGSCARAALEAKP
jgi:hypothetical protein